MDFKSRLKHLRERKSLTQVELAQMLNVKSGAVSKYEGGYGYPRVETLIKLTEIFECSMDYLLGLSSEKNPYEEQRVTPKEAEIIMRYRGLTNENKIRIDERINAMLEAQRRK